MEIKIILAILASALMHAFYNFLMLRAKGNRTFLTQMFVVAFVTAGLFATLRDTFHPVALSTLFIVLGAAIFYVLYQILVAKAYQHGNASTTYPLTVLSPIFVPLWASLFLHEKPSAINLIGIFITVSGAIVIKFDRIKQISANSLLSKKGYSKGALYALTASLVYSFGSILDKARIASMSLPFYLFVLLTAMTLGMVTYTLLFEKEPLFSKFKTHWYLVFIGGGSMFGSFFFFRDALVVLPVTIAVPIRLTSIVFALLFGTFLLKERLTRYNWLGALLIIVGIILVVQK